MLSYTEIEIGMLLCLMTSLLYAQTEISKDSISIPIKENTTTLPKSLSSEKPLSSKIQLESQQATYNPVSGFDLSEPSEKEKSQSQSIDYFPKQLRQEKAPCIFCMRMVTHIQAQNLELIFVAVRKYRTHRKIKESLISSSVGAQLPLELDFFITNYCLQK